MTLHLYNLTIDQIEFLIRLDESTEADFPGLEVADLALDDFRTSYELILLGLVALSPGWRGSFWFRLTAAGRWVRESGPA